MDSSALTQQIIAVLARHSRREPDSIQADEPLFAGGLELDSLRFLEAVLELESMNGVRLRHETLTLESVASVANFVASVLHS